MHNVKDLRLIIWNQRRTRCDIQIQIDENNTWRRENEFGYCWILNVWRHICKHLHNERS